MVSMKVKGDLKLSRFFTSVRILCNRFMVAVALIFGLCVGNSFGTIYSYDLRGGDLPSNVESIESESEEGYITVANPVNTGYEFIGWCADSDFDDNNNNSGSNPDYSDDTCNGTLEDPDWRIPATLDNNAQSRTYYAFWEQTYPIDYNLGNGETNHVDNPNTFKIGDLSITLGNPTSSGYMFMGWCASDMSGGLCSAANTVTQIKVCSTDSTKFCSDNDVEIGSTSAGVSVYPTWVADTTYNSCSDGERATFEINASTGVVTSGCTACPAGYDCQAGTTYRLSNSTYDEDSGKYIANVTDLCTDGYYSVAGGVCTACPDSMNSTTNRTSCVCTGSNEIFHPALGQCVALDNINPGEVTKVIFNADGSVDQINQRTWCPYGSYCTGVSNIVASSVLPSDINNLNGFDCFHDTSNGKVFCYIGRTECTDNTSSHYLGSSSADACVACPSGSTPSVHHETCVCNNPNEILYVYFDLQTQQREWKCAVTATSMPGRYLNIDPVYDLVDKKQYVIGYADTWCDEGSYCPGGEYGYGQCNNGNGIDLTDLSGFDDCKVGRYSCGGYSSVDGATSLADCRACPAGSKTVPGGCECNVNYEYFDRQSWSCIPQSSSCPSLKNNMLYYGDDGLLYAMDRAWDPEAQKCVAYWLAVDTKSDIYPTYAACVAQGNDEYDCFGQLVTQYPNELVNAGANLMLCEQSSERDSKDEAEYFGGCTVAAKLCDINDVNSLFSVIDDGNKIINFVKSLLPANDNGYSAERIIQGTPDMTCVQNLMVEHANDDPAYTVEQAAEHCMNLDVPNWVNDYRCPAPDPEATPVVCPSVFIDLDEDGNIDYDDPTRNFGQWLSLDGEAFTDINNDGVTDVSDCVNGYYYGVFWPGIVAGYGSMVQSLVTKATEQGAENDPVSFMANMTDTALNNPNNAFGSMVFCQYDNDPESSGYGTYTKNCSKPISICGMQHLMENQAILALLPDLDNVRGAMGVTALLSGSGVDIYDPDWKKKLFTSGAGTNLQSRANNFTIADSTCQNYCAAGYTYDIVDEDNDGRVDSVNNMPAYACTQTTYTCDAGQYLGLNTNTGALECATCLPGYSCANADWTTGKGVNDLDLSGKNGIPWGTYGLTPIVCDEVTPELVIDSDGSGYIISSWDDNFKYNKGMSYGNSNNECSYRIVYFDDIDGMNFDAEKLETWQSDPSQGPDIKFDSIDYNNAGAKIALCKFDDTCTKAYTICSQKDYVQLKNKIGDTETFDAGARTLAALAGVPDYNDTPALTALFTEDVNDIEEFDRCFKYGACNPGEYLTGEENLGNKTTQCAPCEAGYYCPGVDLGENWHAGDEFITGKESCPAGTFGLYPGADSEDACLSCSSMTNGNYVNSDAASTSLVQCYATCSGDPDCGNLKHVGTCAYTTGRKYNDGFGICDANVTACDAEHYTPTPVNTLSDNDLPKIGTQGLCNDVPSNDTGEHRFAQNSTGVQCWVRVISIDEMDIDSAWVHSAQYESKEQCASLCGTGNITSSVWSDLMDTISNKNACMPDTININWNGVANSGDAATCTWDGKLTVPNVKPTLTGYTFVGWRHAVTPSAAP